MLEIKNYILLPKEIRKSHIDLTEDCVYRGGNSTQFRGILAVYLGTNIPSGYSICCCHACNNGRCSNPKHLYWGTRKDNVEDSIIDGTHSCLYIKGFGSKEENPNYKKMPWETNNSKYKDWEKAREIFNFYKNKNWDFFGYGRGQSFLSNNFDISAGASKTMIKMFRKGWNPNKDKKWLETFKN